MPKLDKDFLLKKSKSFCMYPWVHLYAEPNGDVHPCCTAVRQGENDVVENLKDKTLEEIFKSDGWNKLRKSMLNDERHPVCTRCHQVEDAGGFSYRNMANSDEHFAEFIDYIDETDDEGRVDSFNYKYIDIRFSNNCNFACSSCGPFWSSKWITQLQKNPMIKNRNLNWVNSMKHNIADHSKVDIVEQITPHLSEAKSIYFAGGEPLIMPEHYRILDYLIENKIFDINIRYNTNMSRLDFKYDILDKWKHFKNIRLGASIDGVGDVAETIRYGTVWKTVEENLKKVKQHPSIDLSIDTVVSIFNIDHLTYMYDYLIEQKIIDKDTYMSFNMAFDPPPFSLVALPTHHKETVKIQLEEWLNNYNGPSKKSINKFITGAVNFMFSKDTYDPLKYVFHYEERLGVQFESAKKYLNLPYKIYMESLDIIGDKRIDRDE